MLRVVALSKTFKLTWYYYLRDTHLAYDVLRAPGPNGLLLHQKRDADRQRFTVENPYDRFLIITGPMDSDSKTKSENCIDRRQSVFYSCADQWGWSVLE